MILNEGQTGDKNMSKKQQASAKTKLFICVWICSLKGLKKFCSTSFYRGYCLIKPLSLV